MNPYDALPYSAWVQPYTCPARIAAVASLHGLVPYDTATARVLEVGCADGTNLIAMALARPGLRCVGIDPSEVQIERGKRMLDAVGIRNVELRVGGAEDVDASLGEFDLVICHGVWSWVPPAVREAIFRTCAERLAPTGIAYVSYNTLPGWYGRLPFRDMMLHAAGESENPIARVERARQMVAAVAQYAGPFSGDWSQRAARMRDRFGGYPDEYLFHEYLAPYNEPVYFKEFVRQAAAHGLQWLAEAELQLDMIGECPYPGAPGDRVGNEQHADYFRNAGFRKSLLVREGVRCKSPRPDGVDAIAFVGKFTATSALDLTQGVGVVYKARNDQEYATDQALYKGAIAVLTDAFPCSVPFAELVEDARAAVGGTAASDVEQLREELLRWFAQGLVDGWVGADGFAPEVSDRPVASAFARYHATGSVWVPSLRHDGGRLSELARYVLRLCDGEHDGTAMVREVTRAVADGKLELEGLEGLTPYTPAYEEVVGAATMEAMSQLYEAALIIR